MFIDILGIIMGSREIGISPSLGLGHCAGSSPVYPTVTGGDQGKIKKATGHWSPQYGGFDSHSEL